MIFYSSSILFNSFLFAICVGLGIYTFPIPLLFDAVSGVVFFILVLVFRKDVDIISICIILILNKVFIDGYAIITNYVDSVLFYKILAYALTTGLIVKTWYDKMSKITTAFLFLSVSAEIYWQITGYDGPEVYFYFFKISMFLLVRYFLIYRAHDLQNWFNLKSKVLRIDWHIYKIKGLAISIECLMICEYLIRHLLPIQPMLLWQFYDVIMQTLGIYVMWIVLISAKNNFQKISIKA